MKVVILCGGQGTRLPEVTQTLPKPMAPIGDRPVLWHIMRLYAHHGAKHFVLCLGYKGSKIREYFLNFKAMVSDCTVTLGRHDEVEFHGSVDEADWKVTLVDTGNNTMTGGRLWRVKQYLDQEEHFCLTYGDGLANLDITRLIDHHKRCGTIATITGVRPTGRYGQLHLNGTLATSFEEKTSTDTGWVNGGFMVFDARRIWSYLRPDDNLMLEQETLPALVRDGQLSVFKHEKFWLGLDTVHEFTLLNEMWERGKAPWRVWPSRLRTP